MDLTQAREEVIKAFDPVTGCYYHKNDYLHHGFIDGMAWVGLLTGAAKRVGDTVLVDLGSKYLRTLLDVGKDARNYAGYQVSSEWVASTTIPGYYYLVKPQAFAGPAGLYYAGMGNIPFVSEILCRIGLIYGLTYPLFESHLDSIILAYLINNRKPPFTMKKLYMSNPFYAAIAGVKVTQIYPSTYRWTEGKTTSEKTIQDMAVCEPDSWIFRRNPYNLYTPGGQQEQYGYTPIWQVVGEYLQQTL